MNEISGKNQMHTNYIFLKIKKNKSFLFSFSSPLEIHFALFKNSFNLFKLHNHLFIRSELATEKEYNDMMTKEKVPIELRGE